MQRFNCENSQINHILLLVILKPKPILRSMHIFDMVNMRKQSNGFYEKYAVNAPQSKYYCAQNGASNKELRRKDALKELKKTLKESL